MLVKWNVHDSIPYNCQFTSSDDTVKQLCLSIYNSIEMDKIKKKELKFNCVTTTLLNLKYSWDTSNYIRVSKRKNYYSACPKRYKYSFYTYDIMNSVVEGLKKLNKIELLPGFKYINDESGQLTKIIPKDSFAEELNAIKRHMFDESEPPELVILKTRGDVKYKKDYQDTAETERMRSLLKEYNAIRQEHTIDLKNFNLNTIDVKELKRVLDYLNKFAKTDDYDEETIHIRNPYIYRAFSDNFNLGGRYYGGIESNMPKVLRKLIHIDGDKTVELDYSSMHIRMLYQQEGIDYREDAYDILSKGDAVLRKLYKVVGLVSINAANEKSIYNGIRNELIGKKGKNKEKNRDILNVLPNLTDKTFKLYLNQWNAAHSRISKHFMNDTGIRLQNTDSRIAEKIIDHFTKKGILVLVVHDSFVISKRYSQELEQVMNDAYFEIMNYNPIIKY